MACVGCNLRARWMYRVPLDYIVSPTPLVSNCTVSGLLAGPPCPRRAPTPSCPLSALSKPSNWNGLHGKIDGPMSSSLGAQPLSPCTVQGDPSRVKHGASSDCVPMLSATWPLLVHSDRVRPFQNVATGQGWTLVRLPPPHFSMPSVTLAALLLTTP